MTEEIKAAKAPENQPAKTLTPVQELMRDVSANPTLVKWPRDQWGFTSAIKKEVLEAAGKVRGNTDKHDLLLATLAVAIAHIQKRQAKDTKAVANSRKFLAATAADRVPRQRVSSIPVTEIKE